MLPLTYEEKQAMKNSTPDLIERSYELHRIADLLTKAAPKTRKHALQEQVESLYEDIIDHLMQHLEHAESILRTKPEEETRPRFTPQTAH